MYKPSDVPYLKMQGNCGNKSLDPGNPRYNESFGYSEHTHGTNLPIVGFNDTLDKAGKPSETNHL